jgi:hypothetical protein
VAIEAINAELCASGIGKLTNQVQLLQLIAQLFNAR